MSRKPKPPPKRKHRATGKPPHRQPAFVPTDTLRGQVKLLLGMGLKQDEVATVVGIAPTTLRKYFPDEIKVAALQVNAQVAKRLYDRTEKDTTAGIFWLKARAGWKDREEITVKGVISLEQAVTNAIAKANGGKK